MGFMEMGKFEGGERGVGRQTDHRHPVFFYDKVTFEGGDQRIVIENGTITGAEVAEIGDVDLSGNLTMVGGGVIRTAASGERIELANSTLGDIKFYSGDANEDSPAIIEVSNAEPFWLRISSADPTSNNQATISLQSDTVAGAAGFITISPPTLLGGYTAVESELRIGNAVTGSALINKSSAAGSPAYSFRGDTDTGIYRYAANVMAFAAGGSTKFYIDATALYGSGATGTPYITRAPGTAASPAYAFRSDTNTGMWRTGTDGIGFSTGGAINTYIRTFSGVRQIAVPDGTVAVPGIGFHAEGNFGIYRIGAQQLGVATAGVLRFAVTATEVQARGDNGVNFFDYGPQTTASAANATWTTGGGGIYRLDRSTSSRRYKDFITDADLADVVLRPVRFWSRLDEHWQYGFIAEEVADVLPEAAEIADGLVENYDLAQVVAVIAAKVNRLTEQCTCGTMTEPATPGDTHA